MTGMGAAILSLLATAWLQALALAGVATIVSVLNAPARLRQLSWRCAVLLPPLTTSALALGHAIAPNGSSDAGPVSSMGGHVELASAVPSSMVTPAASLALGVAGWAWIILAAIVTTRTLLLRRRLRQHLKLIPECSDAPTLQQAILLAKAARVRMPIIRSDGEVGPFAAGRGTIVLPGWAIELPADQRGAVIAHEMRHLQRADTTWSAIVAWTAGVLLLPWGPLALRELERVAEDDCDGWAAARGDGRGLAEALLVCASTRTRQPRLVSTMSRSGDAVRRVRRLIQGEAAALPRTRVSTSLALGGCLSAICASVPVMSLNIGGRTETAAAVVAALVRPSRTFEDAYDTVEPPVTSAPLGVGGARRGGRPVETTSAPRIASMPLYSSWIAASEAPFATSHRQAADRPDAPLPAVATDPADAPTPAMAADPPDPPTPPMAADAPQAADPPFETSPEMMGLAPRPSSRRAYPRARRQPRGWRFIRVGVRMPI